MDASNSFFMIAGAVALVMLIWDCVEVGRNDAANIVNAVFGARVMKRRTAVYLAGLAVILGAWASSQVIETARKGIFDPAGLETLTDALTVFIAVYITDTVLLYSFSAFGMPVSTTACLVFELLGASFALGGAQVVHWDKSGKVIVAIILSIIISGIMGFMVQRVLRGAIREDCEDAERVKLHGPWIAGALMTGLVYFLMIKGMKHVWFVKALKNGTADLVGVPVFLAILWAALSLLVWLILKIGKEPAQKNLFAGLAVIGMLAIAFAFGQNDLANCASPGVAAYMIIKHGEVHTAVDVPSWLLLSCGILLFVGMTTKNAQRVTRAEVNTGSQGDRVRLYAPEWCLKIAVWIKPKTTPNTTLAPKPDLTEKQKVQHYDALRAAVITSVSASVIAFASGMGLPVSTTYVAFAAVLATGWSDKIFDRGDAHLKIGRAVWVIFCWFASALIAAITAGIVAQTIKHLTVWGICLAITANLIIRYVMKKGADMQENQLKEESAKHSLDDEANM